MSILEVEYSSEYTHTHTHTHTHTNMCVLINSDNESCMLSNAVVPWFFLGSRLKKLKRWHL